MSLRQAAEQIIAWYAEGQHPTGDDIVGTLREALAQPERKCEAGVSLQDLWDCWDAVHGGQVKEAKADPYAELKAAAKDPNKEIAIRGREVTLGWHSGNYWKFDRPVEDYVVRDKPKKMKLLAWVKDNGNLTWRREGYVYGPHWGSVWKRAPAEDKEIEDKEIEVEE